MAGWDWLVRAAFCYGLTAVFSGARGSLTFGTPAMEQRANQLAKATSSTASWNFRVAVSTYRGTFAMDQADPLLEEEPRDGSDSGCGPSPTSAVKTLQPVPDVEAPLSRSAASTLDRLAMRGFYQDLGRSAPPQHVWQIGMLGALSPQAPQVWPFVDPPFLHVLSRPPAPRAQLSQPAGEPRAKRPAFPAALRRLARVKLPLSEDALRHRALLRWRVIVELDLEASSLGGQLTYLCDSLRPDADSLIAECLADTFSGKSTATLTKRSSSLLAFFEYCHGQGVSRPLLVQERTSTPSSSTRRRNGARQQGLRLSAPLSASPRPLWD